MRQICLDADADALICLRSLSFGSPPLSLLELLAASCCKRSDPIVLTEYIARHELNALDSEITALEHGKAIVVLGVVGNDPTYKELRKKGVDKGEAEAIAWMLSQPKTARPLFASRDTRAIRAARTRGLSATDVMGLIVEAIISNVVSTDQARLALDVWDDPGQQLCRPANYSGFDKTFDQRKNNSPDYYR